MIGYRWYESLRADQLQDVEDLLAEAVEYDAEAGFSTATPARDGAGVVRHLLVTIAPPGERGSAHLDRLPDVPLVAYLRLDVVDGVAETQCVVRPAFRSHGIATLLAELLDEEPQGWRSVPGLRRLAAWSHGAHPAADRMARRFGAATDHAVFKTLRLIGGSHSVAGETVAAERSAALEGPADLAPGHQAAMAPGELATLRSGVIRLKMPEGGVLVGTRGGGAACIAPDDVGAPDALRSVLTRALLEVQTDGARIAQMYVDALDDTFVSISRELDFHHDQSDLHYVRSL